MSTRIGLLLLLLLLVLSSGAARADILVDPSPSCDPSKQSCVPGSGGGGGGIPPPNKTGTPILELFDWI
ncbi:hypothetical protein HNP55_001159 [Paucibacter oligotrophus]|uniref:Uncharacterized protein n=1 Tax=Roseateles oligotrophus TaxID=1769250 RepID=A0A840L2E7_9BURK|nr:hypothetical protein [Roseateles oligotrophus]MBB4842644.1 hypothetical protein [Roseateles oligotrophus]